MRLLCVVLISLSLWMSGFALAQSYPTRDDPYVNDLADVLPPEQEAELRDMVARIGPDFDLTVLTIQSISDYDPSAPTLLDFSTEVFNYWGIGTQERNTGVLVLLVMDTREIRISMGLDYGVDYNDAMQAVLDESVIPRFREDDYPAGLIDGVAHIYRAIMGRELDADAGIYSINHPCGRDTAACQNRKRATPDRAAN